MLLLARAKSTNVCTHFAIFQKHDAHQRFGLRTPVVCLLLRLQFARPSRNISLSHKHIHTHTQTRQAKKKHAALGIRWRKQCFLDDWCFLFFFDKRHRFGSPRFAKKLAPNNQNEPNADELSPTWYGAPKQVNVYHTQTLILLHYLAVCCGTRDSEHFFREQIKCLL